MKKHRRFILKAMAMAMLPMTSALSNTQDIVVVTHKDNTQEIDLAYISKIYSGSLRSWPDGSAVVALDQPEETEARVQFSSKVLNRSVANMRAIWSQNIFTGKGQPPRVIASDEELKRVIGSNKNAIGYMLASQADSSVKVLARSR